MTTTRFIAEVSSNHHRDLDRCLAFVDAAADLGCDGVKFQQFRVEELFAPEALAAHRCILDRKAWELPEAFNAELAARSRSRGIQFASTPFYLDAVALLEPHVDFFKLASYQLLWTDMLREVARTGKPVVLATGMSTLMEVRRAVHVLREAGCAELTLLHCVSTYPTAPEDANLAAIETMRAHFDVPIGWSDHTVDLDVVERAVRRYKVPMVEFHFDLDGEGEEYGVGHCWLPERVRTLFGRLKKRRWVRRKHFADGDGRKEPQEVELEERRWRTDPSDGLRPLLEVRAELRQKQKVVA